MILNDNKQNEELIANSDNFTTDMVAVEAAVTDVASIAKGLDITASSFKITNAQVSTEGEISNEQALQAMAASITSAVSLGVENYGSLVSAYESESSARARMVYANESMKEMLKKGWAVFVSAIKSAIGSIQKLYYSTMSKVRTFESRIDKIDGKLKKIKALSDEVELEGKEWKEIKTLFAALLAVNKTKSFDLSVIETAVGNAADGKDMKDTIEKITKALEKAVSGTTVAEITNAISELRGLFPTSKSDLRGVLPSNSKIVDLMGEKTIDVIGANVIRIDGKSISVVVLYKKNDVYKMKYLREEIDGVYLKAIRNVDNDAKIEFKDVERLKAMLKTVKKFKSPDVAKSVKSVEKALENIDKDMKDAKEKSMDELKLLKAKKQTLQSVLPALLAVSRDIPAKQYHTTLNVIRLAEFLAEKLKDNKTKPEKANSANESEAPEAGLKSLDITELW